MGFIFAWGLFSRRRQKREIRENYPHANISTFTVDMSGFGQGWSTFSLVFAFCSRLVFRTFLAMLSHICMQVGNEFPYEDLQIKIYFRHK